MPEDRTLERTTYVPETDTPDDLQHAGFWRRVGASFVDQGIIALPWLLVFFLARDWSFAARATTGFLASLTVALGYWAGMESSRWQATLGKRAFGLVVTGLDGERLSFPRAAWRTIGKWLSCLTLGLGFAAAGWTRRKQALHDLLADTLVIRRGPRLPTEALGLPVALGILLSSVSSAVVLPYMERGAAGDRCGGAAVPATAVEELARRDLPLPGGFAVRSISDLSIQLTAPIPHARADRLLRQHFRDAGMRIGGEQASFIPDAQSWTEDETFDRSDEHTFYLQPPYSGIVWRVLTSSCDGGSGSEVFVDAIGLN